MIKEKSFLDILYHLLFVLLPEIPTLDVINKIRKLCLFLMSKESRLLILFQTNNSKFLKRICCIRSYSIAIWRHLSIRGVYFTLNLSQFHLLIFYSQQSIFLVVQWKISLIYLFYLKELITILILFIFLLIFNLPINATYLFLLRRALMSIISCALIVCLEISITIRGT